MHDIITLHDLQFLQYEFFHINRKHYNRNYKVNSDDGRLPIHRI